MESQKKGFGLTDILQILLAVLIFALLGYVVFRSTRKQKVEEPEPDCLSMPCWRLLQITTMKIWKIQNMVTTKRP